jgi:hypothetical protein
VYTLGIWTVKTGREDEFVRAWSDLAERTKSEFPDERATLLRDGEQRTCLSVSGRGTPSNRSTGGEVQTRSRGRREASRVAGRLCASNEGTCGRARVGGWARTCTFGVRVVTAPDLVGSSGAWVDSGTVRALTEVRHRSALAAFTREARCVRRDQLWDRCLRGDALAHVDEGGHGRRRGAEGDGTLPERACRENKRQARRCRCWRFSVGLTCGADVERTHR